VQHDGRSRIASWNFCNNQILPASFSTKEPMQGILISITKIDSQHAPDVVMASAGTTQNQFGIPGMITLIGKEERGRDARPLSRFDMQNTRSQRSDFRRGQVDDLPTGNVDLPQRFCGS
jgi:hypothetical protein